MKVHSIMILLLTSAFLFQNDVEGGHLDVLINGRGQMVMEQKGIPEGNMSQRCCGFSFPTSVVINGICYSVTSENKAGEFFMIENSSTNRYFGSVKLLSDGYSARRFGLGWSVFNNLSVEDAVANLSAHYLDGQSNVLHVVTDTNKDMIIYKNLVLELSGNNGSNRVDHALGLINACLPAQDRIH